MGPALVAENEKKILGTFPNTYTYTKAMAERSLKKNRGNIRVAILRPSIIISCYDEPCQGWIDTVAASGGVSYTIHAGLMHYAKSTPHGTVDLVPCDFVNNMLIALTWYTATEPKSNLNIMHAATTGKNPLNMQKYADYILRYAKYYPYHR